MSNEVIYQYLDGGSYTLTVPSGYSNQVLVYAWGAGGGDGTGAVGGGGGYAAGIVTMNAGDTITVSIGSAGGTGFRQSGGQGGSGNNPYISLDGGSAGIAAPYPGNDDQQIGTGGGGGGASSVFVNAIPILVAAGGGGGGGGQAGTYDAGTPGNAGGVQTNPSSGPRGNPTSSNYATGGAGGGGYPYGGASGFSVGDDAAPGGGQGGQNYANASVASSTLLAGSGNVPGGTDVALYPATQRGYNTYDGAVIIVFQKLFTAWIKQSGTWKQANNAWIKVNGVWKAVAQGWIKNNGIWKSVATPISLNPIKSSTVPTSPIAVNLVIASNTTNYDLASYLAGTAYYPGHSVVTLTVNSGVTVGSTDVLTPAITVDGLTVGDQFTLINNGTIVGRGGDGGSGGSYSSTVAYYTSGKWGIQVWTYGYAPKGTSYTASYSYSSIPGRQGFQGGIALLVNYLTTLINNGTIAGGGGGGGGGGGNTGGQGGGGAGYNVGIGGHNGTSNAGGAGSGIGGAGGALGQPGSSGANDANAGGAGGAAGTAISNSTKVTFSVTGTIIGPIA